MKVVCRLPFLLSALAVVAADLISKTEAFRGRFPGQVTWVFPEWFAITPALNPGVTGGLFRGVHPWILTGVTLAAAFGVLVWLLVGRTHGRTALLALSFILGGAAGNLYDRMRFGHVRDFLDVRPGLEGVPWLDRWPTFNVADAAIVTGVILLLFHSLFLDRKKKRAEEV